ncbi:MAG TPA: GTPase ObgE [Tepiditoga sp.]|nr:GTPase ObgE [Tepiditoga sp.]
MNLDFIDEAEIYVKAGKGGDGSINFRREKYVDKGGPDGGDGGNGGNIVLKSVIDKNTLIDYRYKKKFVAQDGDNGRPKKQFGRNGENILIEVPTGTLIFSEDGELLADMKYPNQIFVVARGGKGGRGNTNFATATMQAPKIAEKGAQGEERTVKLVLKLIADIGLVGFPNVGKSTLISKISNARPKIANYHFTTLKPNLGVVKVDEGKSFVVADIPGLIEGAHEGSGLGDRFLRHIERCHAILHIVDLSGFENRDPVDDYKKIRNELEKYSEILSKKEEIIAGNKTDMMTEEEWEKAAEKFESETGKKIIPFSAYTGQNVDKVKSEMWSLIEPDRLEAVRKLEKIIRETPERVKIKVNPVSVNLKTNLDIQIIKWAEDIYEVTGPQVENLLSKYKMADLNSRLKMLEILEKAGLDNALINAGAKEGNTIYIGDFAFEYIF